MLIGKPPATKLQLTKRRIPTLRETRVEPEPGEHRVSQPVPGGCSSLLDWPILKEDNLAV
jgi:hypothetical protein